MANQLDIYVTEKDGKTISQFSADKIWFHNEGPDDMTIGFKPGQHADLAFCKNKVDDHTKGRTTLDIPKTKKEGVYICSDFPGSSFGYTAQIKNTTLEDPIIILGKDTLTPPSFTASLPVFAGGVLLGVVLTLLARRLFVRQRPT